MTEAQAFYTDTGKKIKAAEESQMFGKPCFKINGKAFISFFEDAMVFKLNGTAHSTALSLKGAKLFDPSGKKRPMKEWVQVPFAHKEKWSSLAKSAMEYVSAK
jgi:hypothetical protein